MEYLTEAVIETQLLPLIGGDWIHNKKFGPGRPDYRNDVEKLIIEFDGIQHYTQPPTILKDKEKDTYALQQGYEVIRIPYFVQLSSDTIKHWFNISTDYTQTYPHGFISEKAITQMLPSFYCSLGVERFKQEMGKYPENIVIQIKASLKQINKPIEAILPIDMKDWLN